MSVKLQGFLAGGLRDIEVPRAQEAHIGLEAGGSEVEVVPSRVPDMDSRFRFLETSHIISDPIRVQRFGSATSRHWGWAPSLAARIAAERIGQTKRTRAMKALTQGTRPPVSQGAESSW